MDEADLLRVKAWFIAYCRGFSGGSEEDRKAVTLKEEHTLRVSDNSFRIAGDLLLDERSRLLAGLIGLLHDVGRFRQYALYKTFKDSVSVNHAVLGAEIIREEGLLPFLPAEEQKLVLDAVKYHNAFALPRLGEEGLLFLKLIRDADKLDIWEVFVDFYTTPPEARTAAAGLGLPDLSEFNPEVLSCITGERMASLSQARTLTDYKLIQLSWVFDLNFTPSLRLLDEREVISRIGVTLPQTVAVEEALSSLQAWVMKRVRADKHP